MEIVDSLIMANTKFSKVFRPVSWGEMDFFGHLNNVHYLRYIEDARIAFLDQFDFFSMGLLSVVLKNECEYKSPVTYPDILTTSSFLTHIGNTSFSMMYEVFSEQQNKIVCIGKSVIVMVDPNQFEKKSIPTELKNTFISYMEQHPVK